MTYDFSFANALRGICAVVLTGTMLSGCASLAGLRETPRVSLVSIAPVDFQIYEQRFLVTLRIQNPNATDITIRGLDYTIEINDKLFAQGVSGKPVSIPAYGEGTAEVEVVSTLQRVLEQLQSLGRRGAPSIDYGISGHVNIDGILVPIPFDYDGTLTVPGLEPDKGGEQVRQPKAIAI
jgi:LEA14-like dessication related protein